MTILFYVLGCWLLFNVAFALAMYFRPVRKPSVDSGYYTSGAGPDVSSRLSRRDDSFDDDSGRGAPGAQKESREPATWNRILFFGFWLRAGRRSA